MEMNEELECYENLVCGLVVWSDSQDVIVLQVGKTLLIQSLVKHYTKHNLTEVRGPITVVSGNKSVHYDFISTHNSICIYWRSHACQTIRNFH